MINYEPELMYALDSKDEYSDWKNVYNVSGSDVLYCPICLGRVKLWNGQDPNRKYKKQKCFHHIDGMCSQESRIHFAYKTWLLEKGSKFKIGEKVYEVNKSEIEKTFHTKFGDYRPDIVVETTNNQKFFIEITNANKKSDEFIEKLDELSCDVLELDVNEQMVKTVTNDIPELKTIYSSITGECYIKHYMNQDYDDLITERKIYWKREDLLNYKIQWERLDWFWKTLQDFYNDNSKMNVLIDTFKVMNPQDQRFICQRMRGKHRSLRQELEKHYSDKEDVKKAHLRHISTIIRKLNQEFGYSSCNEFIHTYLFREGRYVFFNNGSRWIDRPYMRISKTTTESDVYNYFHPIMQKYYEEYTIPLKQKLAQENAMAIKNVEYFKTTLKPYLNKLKEKMNNCPNKLWKMDYKLSTFHDYKSIDIYITIAHVWESRLELEINSTTDSKLDKTKILKSVEKHMNYMLTVGFDGWEELRILERSQGYNE